MAARCLDLERNVRRVREDRSRAVFERMGGRKQREELRLTMRARLAEDPRQIGASRAQGQAALRAASATVSPSVNAVAKDSSDWVKSNRLSNTARDGDDDEFSAWSPRSAYRRRRKDHARFAAAAAYAGRGRPLLRFGDGMDRIVLEADRAPPETGDGRGNR